MAVCDVIKILNLLNMHLLSCQFFLTFEVIQLTQILSLKAQLLTVDFIKSLKFGLTCMVHARQLFALRHTSLYCEMLNFNIKELGIQT